MNQMAFDQTMQCVQGRRLKIGIGNDPINNHRTMIQKHLDQVVAGAAKPVEPRLADPAAQAISLNVARGWSTMAIARAFSNFSSAAVKSIGHSLSIAGRCGYFA
ncbi:hypothetical protein [Klebsiella pneumoniae]|uniref:hypothetical protein n=1 Tax=Klebsiella pneumoniae TaxID=573 RepID=UPI00296E65D8|nr:hypothetical protein [Klebsiella pneumoniae]